ncbi:hypothetical protein BDA96_06G063800 [Sorghum bicolor]|uniref:Uncharacterized protein n=1 Tax=Sorghum bicolor TaxID=4558 RepID=A0A921UC93_SORBI|nr:hypothetical protein BDA96_06G063800 [Sorghum bicolor]
MSGTASGARATLPPRRRWCRTCHQLTTSWFCSTAEDPSRQRERERDRQTEDQPTTPPQSPDDTHRNVDSGTNPFVGTASCCRTGNRRHDGRPQAPDRQHATAAP